MYPSSTDNLVVALGSFSMQSVTGLGDLHHRDNNNETLLDALSTAVCDSSEKLGSSQRRAVSLCHGSKPRGVTS